MSTPTAQASTSVATIWEAGQRDAYGQMMYSQPYTVRCSFRSGGRDTYTDDQGITKTPKTTYWTELLDAADGYTYHAEPGRDSMIVIGAFLSEPAPVSGAEAIKMVQHDDMSMFGERDDFVLMTG